MIISFSPDGLNIAFQETRRPEMRAKLLIFFLALISFPLTVRSEESLLTLTSLEQEALKNNPEILMASKKAESAGEKKSLASALPDPMIGYMVQNEGAPATWSVGQQSRPMSMQGVVFTQEIP